MDFIESINKDTAIQRLNELKNHVCLSFPQTYSRSNFRNAHRIKRICEWLAKQKNWIFSAEYDAIIA